MSPTESHELCIRVSQNTFAGDVRGAPLVSIEVDGAQIDCVKSLRVKADAADCDLVVEVAGDDNSALTLLGKVPFVRVVKVPIG